MNLETDPNLEQFYAAATEQASETSDEEGVSVFDILNEPLPPLSRAMPENSVPDTAVQPSPEKDTSNSLVASTEVTVEDPLSLLGLPGACAITVNGQSVPAALYIDSSCAIEQSVITQENTVIRYIYQDSNGYRSGSAVVNPGATDTFFTGTAISDETGKGQVSSEELTMLMTAYYQKYLQAINEQDTSVMCMITDVRIIWIQRSASQTATVSGAAADSNTGGMQYGAWNRCYWHRLQRPKLAASV